MSTERTLDRIDDTLEQWDQWDGHSPDAARWDGDDWVDERRVEWRDPAPRSLINVNGAAGRLWVVEPENATELGSVVRFHYGEPSEFTFPQRVMVGIDPASPQHLGFMVVPEVQPYVEAVQESFAHMAQAVGFTLTEWRVMLGHFIDPALWDRAVRQPPRPMAAAERTNSARRRAGSRRTKRQARRRT